MWLIWLCWLTCLDYTTNPLSQSCGAGGTSPSRRSSGSGCSSAGDGTSSSTVSFMVGGKRTRVLGFGMID